MIITGNNGSAPTLGTAITCATGSLNENGEGDSIMTGLGTPTTANAVTEVQVVSDPTVTLSVDDSNGDVSVVIDVTPITE